MRERYRFGVIKIYIWNKYVNISFFFVMFNDNGRIINQFLWFKSLGKWGNKILGK